MKKLFLISFVLVLLVSSSFWYMREDGDYTTKFPSYNANYPPPAGYVHPFELSQSYPNSYNKNEKFAWQKIDFKSRPEAYLNAVLNYCLQGNTNVDFRVQQNSIRKWYHAPWLDDDSKYNANGKYMGNGREYLHGLTRERFTPAYELHARQDVDLETWAIGFYNERGGYILNKVWRSADRPRPELATFPEGTVTFKLLFTDGSVEKVPFLKGSLTWTANIYPCNPLKPEGSDRGRINRNVRLLQIDVAVKDHRAQKTGWVFGTFIYNGSCKGASIWKRMVPVGLSWGDDSEVTDQIQAKGSYVNEKIHESFINPKLIETAEHTNADDAYMRHFGLGGRLNGPVDNPNSSCISCHARAANDTYGNVPVLGKLASSSAFNIADFREYFRTLPAGTGTVVQNGITYTQTDYSMQLAIGIRNYYAHQGHRQEKRKQ